VEKNLIEIKKKLVYFSMRKINIYPKQNSNGLQNELELFTKI